MKNNKRKSSWGWYAVVLLFESIVTTEPNKDKIDEHYESGYKLYEEQIVLIKAQSHDHAYKIADKKAKISEMEYYNPYGQLVKCNFVDSVNCQQLFDDEIKCGTEAYSRMFKVPVEMKPEKVIEAYIPEAIPSEENKTPFYNFLINE